MTPHPSRRQFLWTAASTVVAATARGTAQPSTLTVGAVIARMQDKLGVPWREGSRDGLKAGAPDAIVTGIATTVMATADVLRRAAAAGRNLVFTQEPVFYTPNEDGGNRAADAVYLATKELIEQRRLVVWRLSDHWHARKPNESVVALANALGWSAYRQPDVEGLYAIPETRLDALIERVRTRLQVRGGLRWLGRPDMAVRTVHLSPGTTDLASTVARMPRADLLMAGEPREWEAVPYVLDAGAQKAVVSLGRIVSLEPGAGACAAWIRSFTPEVGVEAIAIGDPYWSAS